MLKITTHNPAPLTSFVLEGKLVGPWVKELEKCGENALAADPSRAVLVNLAAVFICQSHGHHQNQGQMENDKRQMENDRLVSDAWKRQRQQ